MTPCIHLCLVLHNHQPIGNSDEVFEQAYQGGYLPLLDAFEPHSRLAISLHISGPLMMWLVEHHPEYVDRLRLLVDAGRVEILGGPQYEPILTMVPQRDRIGQIRSYSAWLERTLGTTIAGMWTPESVWEPHLTSDLVSVGIDYTVLDDAHFQAAGLVGEQLAGYFLTEHEGAVLRVFPGSERLRGLVPTAPVQETIDYCWQIAQSHPGAVLTLGVDEEKFGIRSAGQQPVFERGWLHALFDSLTANARWLRVVTLAEAVQRTRPAGKVHLTGVTRREVLERALPLNRRRSYADAVTALQASPQWDELQPLFCGGSWRNCQIQYAEAGEMYAHMMHVSRRLQHAQAAGGDRGELAVVRDHLYRSQCHNAYWQGRSEGISQPHLRSAVFRELIQADTLLDRIFAAIGETLPYGDKFVQAKVEDFNFDLVHEVRLASNQFTLWLDPSHGGRLYQWDVRAIAHNLLATMQRRPEIDHRQLNHSLMADGEWTIAAGRGTAEPREWERLTYDRYPRKAMLDHFFDDDVTLEQVAAGRTLQRGDFVDQPFTAKVRRANDRVQLQMRRDGHAWGMPITITKAVTLFAGSDEIGITYLLENLPPHRSFHFGIEMNFAGLQAGADDRFFVGAGGERLGHLGQSLDLHHVDHLGLIDQTLGLTIALETNRRGGLWAFPVLTAEVGQSGLEFIQQSVCVMPHWMVQGDASGRWAVQMTVRAAAASGSTHAETTQRLEAVG